MLHPGAEKRRKEIARQERQKEKNEKREKRKQEKGQEKRPEGGEDPDIAGIQIGPQPPRED